MVYSRTSSQYLITIIICNGSWENELEKFPDWNRLEQCGAGMSFNFSLITEARWIQLIPWEVGTLTASGI